MTNIDSQGKNIVLMTEEHLVNIISLAYNNGHNDTVESCYFDPREVLDHILDLIDDSIREKYISIHKLNKCCYK